MTLDEIQEVLRPFAEFAEVFKHNIGGLPGAGESFFTKSFSVQGNERVVTLNVNDFFAAEAAHKFVASLPRPAVQEGASITDKVEGEVRPAKPEDVAAEAKASQEAAGDNIAEVEPATETKKKKS